jgi:hypothetical protein
LQVVAAQGLSASLRPPVIGINAGPASWDPPIDDRFETPPGGAWPNLVVRWDE